MPYECWNLADIPEGADDILNEGYYSGYRGEPEPGPGSHPAFIHGWWQGAADGYHIPIQPWQRALARRYINSKRKDLN